MFTVNMCFTLFDRSRARQDGLIGNTKQRDKGRCIRQLDLEIKLQERMVKRRNGPS